SDPAVVQNRIPGGRHREAAMEVVQVVRRWLALLVGGALARREKLHRAHLGDVESIPCCPMDEKRTPRGFGKCHGEVALLGVVVPLQFQARAAGLEVEDDSPFAPTITDREIATAG